MKVFASLALAVVVLVVRPEPDDVTRCWDEMRRDPSTPPTCLLSVTSALAPRVVRDLDPGAQAQLGRALAASVLREVDPSAEVVLETLSNDEARYRVTSPSGAAGQNENELVLARDGAGWRDVRWNGSSLLERYRKRSERLVSRYSFEYLLGELSGAGVVVLADFEQDSVGSPPVGWKRRVWGSDDGRTPYAVQQEAGNRFLRAEARDENVMLYKEVRWSAREYPYLGWRWRVRRHPAGADEQVEEKADNAAGLYLSYRRSLGLVPETVKFVWSGRYGAGTTFRRPGIGMPWTVVASSGEADSRWRRVVYRTNDVYDETFGGDPGERPLGLGLLTDANNTGSFASADYDDIVALKVP